MKNLYFKLTLALLFLSSISLNAQTLSAGDIAFVQYNADGTDNFAFVALVDIPPGEVIKFTDNEENTLTGGEGTITWVSPVAGISCGTLVTITTSPIATHGSVTEMNDLNFSGGGDSILAYQGTTGSPNFIAALSSDGGSWGGTNDGNLPSGLTNGLDAVALNPEIDNSAYTGIINGDKATLLAAINNENNWSGSNTLNQTFSGVFTVTDCAAGGPVDADNDGFTDDVDCDDTNAAINSGATEVCDGIDNNCDGNIDEGVLSTFYADTDSDGFGDPNVTTQDCSAPAGFVADNTDCDDTEANAFPGNTEICDGIDNDCDGLLDSDDNDFVDNEDPTAICQGGDIIVKLSEGGTLTTAQVDNGSNDNCGSVTLSLNKTSFGCEDVGATVITNTVWINEFHYDNDGSDTGEFIEVVANFDASDHELVLYNGNGGATYNMSGISFSETSGDFNIYTAYISGIQNGNPDGVALIDGSSVVIEFLSYEGSFTATAGPANGLTSTDIGVSESSSTPAGESLQLTGSGGNASAFTWSGPMAETAGTVNTGQTLVNGVPGVEVTLTVTDDNNNMSTCTAIVTVIDDVAPTAICKNITVQLDATGNATILAGDVDGGSNDDCGINLSIDRDAFTCADVGATITSNTVWINEFHYDNDGSDTGEFIEVVANFDASDHELVLYNGNGGATYNMAGISFVGTSGDFNIYTADISGIQNGDPDGVALIDGSSVVIEFLSYEGSFTAVGGPADGVTSTDIGVSESSSTPAGESLQLTGSGGNALAFTWSGPMAETPGTANTGQTLISSGVPGVEVTLTVTDDNNNMSTCTAIVTVVNTAPVIDSLTLPTDPTDISHTINGSATFTDTNLVSASWDWGDLNSSIGNINGSDITGSHNYSTPGVYEVVLTIEDACEEKTSATYQYVVIYDPSGGFVTGGGWIDSPAGAYYPDVSLTGKANFGFVSKYKKGQSVPDGKTEFQFKAGDLNFKSTSYDWLIIAGTKAMFKGDGTINGAGDYGFILSAKDESKNGGDDTFRIKIWNNSDDAVVYDNQLGDDENADATTVIGGGSIIVHKPKGKNNSRESNSKEDIPVEETIEGSEVVFWPNPSKNVFNLKFNSDSDVKIGIHVYDMSGRLVHQRLGFSNKTYQFGSFFSSGIYIVNLTVGDKKQSLRLVKY